MNCAEVENLVPLYLSGELDAAQTAAVNAHMQICAGCAAEIEQQRDLDARVRGALLADSAGAAGLAPGIQRRIAAAEARRRNIMMVTIAAGLVLAAGFPLYRVLVPHVPEFVVEAVKDHRREVVEKQLKKWRSDPAEIQTLAEKEGIQVKAIPLVNAGYRLDRARRCRLDGNIFMHLVYKDGEREMSVFLRPRKGVTVPLREESMGPDHVAAVQSGNMSVVCVAESADAALKMAQAAATL
jgi:anti-sigma factor RsiW